VTKSQGIEADYSRSPESLYRDFAASWITNGKKVEDMLIFSGCGAYESHNPELPSWVPDWQSFSKTPNNFDAEVTKYSAGQTTKHNDFQGKLPRPSVLGNVLSAAGIISCEVSSIGKVIEYGAATGDHFEVLTEYVSRKDTTQYPTGIPLLQAAVRVTFHDWDVLNVSESSPRLVCQSRSFVDAVAALLQLIVEILATPQTHPHEWVAQCLSKLNLATGTEFADSFCRLCLGEPSDFVESWGSAEHTLLHTQSSLNARMDVQFALSKNVDKRFFQTSSGLLGLGPMGMKESDLVDVLLGCDMPVILRKAESHYLFVGSCFVLGITDGEVLDSNMFGGPGKIQIFDIH
jgi:hypothetical protein